MNVYLDNQATTPCDPRVVEAMLPYFTTVFGNPHSAGHAFGHAAAAAVEIGREQVASLIGAEAREIVFTSGATEANNLAIKGAVRHRIAQGNKARRVITVATEHKCVLESVHELAAEGCEPLVLPVQPDGRLDPGLLADALRVPTLLVSIMAANNETGVLHDLSLLAPIARAAGATMHSDMAQLAGKLPVTLDDCDLASFSAHKMYGPKGVGALYVRRRPRVRLQPLFSGGGQERGLRSGTLPSASIVGFGVACALAQAEMADEARRTRMLRDRLWEGLHRAMPGLVSNGDSQHRLPGALNLRLPAPLRALELIDAMPDLAVSTGSACSSADVVPSYVLTAMGLTAEEAARSLRLSVGRFTSSADIAQAIEIVCRALHSLAFQDGSTCLI
ncbi:cysteine desulfurase [Neoasaia chiangmaiensis NBRC 101099]|uniref:Cysteine desulfurase n=1 Tax=Neoasaia chiangmaiensis TaxID=320497 RepID=A0A1U9KTC2_9PROT|nr:aminotransferase class V-fold PLP-dependent enzyme [Neoasaia chiangmaiensis]AQS88989.1 cysteine desulfurase IscS [Neoasaia chiangmaiensis]GBR40202.1 cysteine desulfurase [Neoasaia chiangmaiensis NBRC 101099]GEN14011.1 cysteine desulfurase IscS [Neoasaia chiangmaiensis]